MFPGTIANDEDAVDVTDKYQRAVASEDEGTQTRFIGRELFDNFVNFEPKGYGQVRLIPEHAPCKYHIKIIDWPSSGEWSRDTDLHAEVTPLSE